MTARALLIVLVLLSLPALAQDKPRPNWIADAKTGCRVSNPDPGPDESVSWSGDCKDGFAEGRGVLQWFLHGKPGDRYEGEFRGGKFDGHGTYTFVNGGRYEGEFGADRPTGTGTYTTDDGEVFSGTWANGCFSQGNRQAGVLSSKEECGAE